MERFSSPRHFQLWDFYISFGQLLLRSTPDEGKGESGNIDISFRGVFYLDIPATLTGIQVDDPTATELTHLVSRTGTPQDPTGKYHKYFALASKGSRYYVGAMDIAVTENTLRPMETSLGIAYQIPS